MCGTITLYDDEGERLFTSYCAKAPEYGKATFTKRFTSEIQKVKKRYPNAVYVGVADGAPDNWTFLDPFVDVSILDYFHVSEYVADAAEALFAGKTKKNQRQIWFKETLHQLKHNFGEAKRLNEELQKAVPSNKYPATLEKLNKV